MSVFEIRYYHADGRPASSVDQIIATTATLPRLGDGENAVATRVDVRQPAETRYWHRGEWSATRPRLFR